ncbi:MAG: hypothetical protein WBM50_16805 [Acidimicrobiales bacterium]
MFLRVTRGRVDPSKADEVYAMGSQAEAGVKAQPGCHDCQAGIDRQAGTTVVVATFDTLEHAKFSREDLGEEYLQALAKLGWKGDPPEFYEMPPGWDEG